MRTALCLYGQPRFYKIAYDHLYKKIIEKYSADVFIHTYWSENHIGEEYPVRVRDAYEIEDIIVGTDIINGIQEIYKPVLFMWEWYDSPNIYKQQPNVFQYYTQFASKNLKCIHQDNNKFKYDMVFRSRFDFVTSNMQYEFDMNRLWVPDTCPNGDLFQDAFSVSNSYLHDQISDCYLNLEEFETTGNHHTEYAFKSQIEKMQISTGKICMTGDILRSNKYALTL